MIEFKNKKAPKKKRNARKKFYVTTPIYYVNAAPHLGHAYTTIAADVLARWHRLKGEDVFFLTGTDEHGLKVQKAAEEAGKSPQQFVDDVVWQFMNAWRALNISYDDFIRTTEERHENIVREVLKKIYKNGDIYKGEYEGWYCVPCENFWTELQLAGGNCPDCGREVRRLKEESYFFRLSKYRRKLLNLYKKEPKFVAPRPKRNEMLARISGGLHDLSISRKTVEWGIPFPLGKGHTTYVWVEALQNYITALGYPDGKKFKKYWPADVHLIGKEINWFHSVIWPAMLMSLKIRLPRQVFVHGWWTVNGQKMSKSVGNVVDPVEVVNKFGVDQFRYFLMREVPLGSDGDYSEDALIARINGELADDLGNLVQRSIVLCEKYFSGTVPKSEKASKSDEKLIDLARQAPKKVNKRMDRIELSHALEEIWKLVSEANRYVNETEPWRIKDKKRLSTVIYNLLESLRFVGVLVYSFMPGTGESILGKLGVDEAGLKDLKWGRLKPGTKVTKGDILFKKIERKHTKKEVKYVDIEDFKKLDLRVAVIKSAEPVEGADKLLKLRIDIGGEERQIVAGIRTRYPDYQGLIGKQIVVIANLKPAKIRGVESRGMLLAAGDGTIITTDKEVKSGGAVS